MRGEHIKATAQHDAGAYARCSHCGRYTDDPRALLADPPPCQCGWQYGWSGSFQRPTEASEWSTHNAGRESSLSIDKEKLLAFAAALRTIHAGEMTTEVGRGIARRALNELVMLAAKIEQQAGGM